MRAHARVARPTRSSSSSAIGLPLARPCSSKAQLQRAAMAAPAASSEGLPTAYCWDELYFWCVC